MLTMSWRPSRRLRVLAGLVVALVAAVAITPTIMEIVEEHRAKDYLHDDSRFPDGIDDSLEQLGIRIDHGRYHYTPNQAIALGAWLELDISGTGCDDGDASCLSDVAEQSNWLYVENTTDDTVYLSLQDNQCYVWLETAQARGAARFAHLPDQTWILQLLCGTGI